MRGGPLAYIVVGALILRCSGSTAAGHDQQPDLRPQGGNRQAEAENSAAEAKVAKLAAYTQLRDVRDQRVATVTSLADSRFDWERVMRELALILPSDVWLTNLTGTASPASSVNGGGQRRAAHPIPGPRPGNDRLRPGQDAVAGFVTGPQGHRRRHPGRGAVLEAPPKGRRRRSHQRVRPGHHRWLLE